MTAKSLAHVFSALSRQQQAETLAAFGHALTIDARDTYIAGTEAIADPVRLRGYNEVQHRVFGYLRGVLRNAEQPHESFMAMLLESRKILRAAALGAELEKLETNMAVAASAKRRAG